MNDSLGQPDPQAYNAVHWNGSDWELKRIYYYGNCSAVEYPPLKAILAFSGNELVVTNGGSIGWFDGNILTLDCEINPLLTGSINKIWGNNINNLFTIGNNGSIVHYNGTNWQKIESGTELNIYDIYGEKTTNGEYEIICVASDLFLNQGKKILRIENNIVSTIPDAGLSNSLHTVWFVPGKKYFIGGDGLFSTSSFSESWLRHQELPSYYKDAVRGNSLNDIVVAGAFGLLLHYNGNSWKNFQDLTYINGELGRVDIKGNVVCSVGYDDNKAVVIVGWR